MARDTLTGCATTFSDQTNDELQLVAHLVGYSSGAIGRLVAADTINFIKYMQHQTH